MTFNVKQAFKLKEVLKDVGIELEYEGVNLPKSGFETFWNRVPDNSLRGDSGEWVLKKPIFIKELPTALECLDAAFKLNKTQIIPTYRAGTHVHINVQELTVGQLFNYLVLYFMFENTLLKLCSPERTGNHFCLRLKDASSLSDLLMEFVKDPHVALLANDNFRYAAVNITSLPKFGSLEFRALESTTDWTKLILWTEILHTLKQASLKFENPAAVLLSASGDGFGEFGRKVFGSYWKILSPHFVEEDVRSNVWEIQHSVFSRDWAQVNLNIFSRSNIFD